MRPVEGALIRPFRKALTRRFLGFRFTMGEDGGRCMPISGSTIVPVCGGGRPGRAASR